MNYLTFEERMGLIHLLSSKYVYRGDVLTMLQANAPQPQSLLLNTAEAALLNDGDYIGAIKDYKSRTGLTLRESKKVMDAARIDRQAKFTVGAKVRLAKVGARATSWPQGVIGVVEDVDSSWANGVTVSWTTGTKYTAGRFSFRDLSLVEE